MVYKWHKHQSKAHTTDEHIALCYLEATDPILEEHVGYEQG